MARRFPQTINNYLLNDTAPVTAYPFTISAWARRSGLFTADGFIVSICADAADDKWGLRINNTDRLLRFRTESGASQPDAIAGLAVPNERWFHALARGISATDRRVYLDGQNAGTNTTNLTPTIGNGRVIVGAASNNLAAIILPWGGDIAEVAIWNVDLEAAERTALALGRLPNFVRPDALVAYWPLGGLPHTVLERDYKDTFDLTITGTLPIRVQKTPFATKVRRDVNWDRPITVFVSEEDGIGYQFVDQW